MNRDQSLHLALAGTVTFPATFPRLATLRLDPSRPSGFDSDGGDNGWMLSIFERPSSRVTLIRRLPANRARAAFLPRDPRRVDLGDGMWLIGPEVTAGLRLHFNQSRSVLGIVYVAENTPTLLEVQAGLTAAENAQYYPPLPCDRSHNHYDPYAAVGQAVPSASRGSMTGNSNGHLCEPDGEWHPQASGAPFGPTGYCEPEPPMAQQYQYDPSLAMMCEPFHPVPYPPSDSRPRPEA